MQKEGATVHFMAKNTIASDTDKKESSGIGIENLRKRLNLLYPGKHRLEITNDGTYFTVNLFIDLSE